MLQLAPITLSALLALAQSPASPPQDATPTWSLEAARAALADWEVLAATSGDEPSVEASIARLSNAANSALEADPNNAALAEHVAHVTGERRRFLVERGLAAQPAEPVQEPPAQDSSQRSEDAIIAQAVRSYVSEKNYDAINKLGIRAIPNLEALARTMTAETASGAPAVALDALATMDAGRASALSVAYGLSQQPSYLVRQRLAYTIETKLLFARDDVWHEQPDGNRAPAKAEWGRLIEQLLSEPAVSPAELRNTLARCAVEGFMPRGAQEAILRLDLSELPRLSALRPGTRPLLLAALVDPKAHIRQYGVEQVTRWMEDETRQYALCTDPATSVRAAVASSLRTPWTDEERRAFEVLIDDEQQQTRNTALRALQAQDDSGYIPIASPDELLALAARMEHDDARAHLIGWLFNAYAEDYGARIAEVALAHDAPEVTQALTEALQRRRIPLSQPVYWRVLDRALTATDRAQRGGLLGIASDAATDTNDAGREALLSWLESNATGQEWRDASVSQGGRNNFNGAAGWLGLLDDAQQARFMRAVTPSAPGIAWRLVSGNQPVQHDGAPWAALVLDRSLPPLTRFFASRLAITEATWSDALVNAMREALVLALPSIPDGASRNQQRSEVHELSIDRSDLRTIVKEQGWRLARAGGSSLAWVRALIEEPALPDDVVLTFEVPAGLANDAQSAATFHAIQRRFPLDTWGEPMASTRLLESSLALTAALPAEERLRVFEVALKGWGRLVTEALNAIAFSGDPKLLDVLRARVFDGTPIDDVKVAEAAASFLSDDGAKLILDVAARSTNATIRAAILEKLEHVTTYQDAKARWEQRNDATQVRVRAIADLVALLEDAQQSEVVHVEALRGLALLGAVEELPRLVRALASPNEALRAAAREALDRLHALTPK